MWSKRFPWLVQLLLLGFFALGGLLRLIDLTDPPLDFHPTRQLRSAIFAREIYYRMLPDIDPDLRATAIAHANTIERYEPRLLETIVAVTYRVIGAETLWVARLYTTLFWLVGGLALFALARRMTSPEGSLVAVGYYLLLPFGVQASRSFQPDPFMVMWFILSIYFLYRWTQERTWRWAILAGVSGGLGVLVKVVIAYLVAGAALASVLTTTGLRRALRDLQVWAMALLMIVPPTIYYIFIKDPGSTAEYVSSWTLALLRLIIAPDFYVRWMSFLHTLLGLTPIFLGLAGVIISRPQNRAILLGMWIGYGLYGLSLPYQMYTHNYYHLQLIPIVALSLAPVAHVLLEKVAVQPRSWQVIIVLVGLVAVAYPSWVARSTLMAADYRAESEYWEYVAESVPRDGPVIALTQDYGFRLMYFGGLRVSLWPITAEQELASLRGREREFSERFDNLTEGRAYFLVTAMGQLNQQVDLREHLESNYPLVVSGDGFLVYDLRAAP
jgi:hypothetical protein